MLASFTALMACPLYLIAHATLQCKHPLLTGVGLAPIIIHCMYMHAIMLCTCTRDMKTANISYKK